MRDAECSCCVVAGIGVHPRIDLAVKAGIAVEHGVVVNPYLETSVKGVLPQAILNSGPTSTLAAEFGLNT